MHIGLIGGIGVAATLVYYQRLTAAVAAKGVSPELTIVHADAQVLVKNNLADDREAQAAVYLPLLERLKAAGCDCAAITSLGGHFCFEETAAISPLPLVSAVTPLDAYFADEGLETVGLLGTEVVMRTRLYGQLAKTTAIAPENTQEVGGAYLNIALSGACSDDQRAYFMAEGAALIERGAEAVILAGTDLGLAFDGQSPGYRVIDALDVHVDLLARLSVGEASLD
ncbi:MAG: aspartate/glutamate racemase family protein [Pseudomonadota bacterium]